MQLSEFDRDGDGFLKNLDDWTPEFARLVAADEGVDYNDALDGVITWARGFFDEYQMAPKIADFKKGFYDVGDFEETGRKAAANYLARLTNGSGMKRIDKIAGLPKPTGCV